MANSKISALPASTVPLAGTEVLPIVQSGSTKQVSVQNILSSAQPTGTANGVVYLNGSKIATTGTALQFDGTNIGVGAAPSAWYAGSQAVQNSSGSLWQFGSSNIYLGQNYYLNTSVQRIYSTTAAATEYNQSGGAHRWYTAASGTAGNVVTFTQGMNLDASSNLNVLVGNVVIGTSGKGIDFSATAGTGTSELFADYEEGTWTPIDASGAGLGFTLLANSAKYTKIGRVVHAQFALDYPVTASGVQASIGGLPFTIGTGAGQGGYVSYTTYATVPSLTGAASTTQFYIYIGGGTGLNNVNLSGLSLRGTLIYTV
jgi:hypothetical protein